LFQMFFFSWLVPFFFSIFFSPRFGIFSLSFPFLFFSSLFFCYVTFSLVFFPPFLVGLFFFFSRLVLSHYSFSFFYFFFFPLSAFVLRHRRPFFLFFYHLFLLDCPQDSVPFFSAPLFFIGLTFPPFTFPEFELTSFFRHWCVFSPSQLCVPLFLGLSFSFFKFVLGFLWLFFFLSRSLLLLRFHCPFYRLLLFVFMNLSSPDSVFRVCFL